MFSEKALIRRRSIFRGAGVTNLSEVAGGLNQITIRRFEELVEASPLRFAALELVANRKLRAFQTTLTREFTTAIVRCRLVKRS
jgi:hypothetical protein